jgi:glycosyltransferase involved in cell wall biosynthesis
VMLEQVAKRASEFDVIHFHIDYLHFPLSRRQQTPQLTTLHGRLDLPDLVPLYQEFDEMPVVSISNAQRQPLSWLNWLRTVYHGLPEHLFSFGRGSGDYLCFVGRISPEKRVDRAIEIAQRAEMRLKIAAKVDRADREYFAEVVAPLLRLPGVEYLGELGDREKNDLLGDARAVIFPIDWPEPFGLIMIEAMACGTPVIAYHRGSVAEIIDEGVTGFIVDDIEDATRAVARAGEIDRTRCRQVFEQRFDATRMAHDYVELYRDLVKLHESAAHPHLQSA